jgi:hypothetical protein
MFESIEQLNSDRWDKAKQNARLKIAARTPKPTLDQYLAADSKYSATVMRVGGLLLVLVALAAFVISAGRQIAAFDTITAPLAVGYSTRISAAYVDLVLIAALGLSEFGVIVFGAGAKVIAKTNIEKTILRLFQVLSILIAISGNLTVWALNYSHNTLPVVELFDLLITISAPTLVVGIGVMIERLVSDNVAHRHNAMQAYALALKNWEQSSAAPEKHPDWFEVWGNCILDQLRATKKNRDEIDRLIADDPTVRQELVYREYKRYEWKFMPVATPARPMSEGEMLNKLYEPVLQSTNGHFTPREVNIGN